MNEIPVELTLTAQLRALEQRGDFYTILHRGDPHRGVILCVWRCAGETHLYAQERNIDGVLGWHKRVVEVDAVDRYIARARDRDPDCWVVEVDTRQNQFPLEGPVFTDAHH